MNHPLNNILAVFPVGQTIATRQNCKFQSYVSPAFAVATVFLDWKGLYVWAFVRRFGPGKLKDPGVP